jgi:hypothetical protein
MTEPFNIFDAIFVINLRSRQDRRQEMAEQLRRIGMDLYRSPVRLFPAARPESLAGFPSLGARGCFESHLGVIQLACKEGHRRILILEDDLDFVSDFSVRFPEISSELRHRPWDIVYGGYELTPPIPLSSERLVEISSDTGLRTSHFVGFDGNILPELIAYLEAICGRPPGHPDGGPMHVDGAYGLFRRAHPEFRTLIAIPELGYQRASRSDITPVRWYDRVPVVRNVVGQLRRLRRMNAK